MSNLPPPPPQGPWGGQPPPPQGWGDPPQQAWGPPPGTQPGGQWNAPPPPRQPATKKDRKIGLIACGSLFALMLLIGLVAGGGEDDEDPERETRTERASADSTEPPTTAGPAWADGAPITEDAIVAQLADSPRKLMGADVVALSEPESVVIDEPAGRVTLTYYLETAWDEDAMVQHGNHIAYSATRSMFVNPLVQDVVVTLETDFVDVGGNSSREPAVTTQIGRATVDSVPINWDGLGDRLELNDEDWFCVVDAKNVHPALLANGGVSDDSCYWS